MLYTRSNTYIYNSNNKTIYVSIALSTRELIDARYSIKEWAGKLLKWLSKELNITCPWKSMINGHNCQKDNYFKILEIDQKYIQKN